MIRWPTPLRTFCAFIGLDYLPYVVCKHFADSAADTLPPEGEKPSELLPIAESDASKEALDVATALLSGEERRLETIERKAITLLGTTGVTAAFVVGFASLSLDLCRLGLCRAGRTGLPRCLDA